MSLQLSNIILLLAGAQGFFLTVLIFHKHRKLFANIFLAIMIFIYSAMLLHLFLSELGYEEAFKKITFFIIGLGFVVAPLHYLYAKYLIQQKNTFLKKDWLHFTPFFIYEIYYIILFILKGGQVFIFDKHTGNDGLPLDSMLYNWIVIIQCYCYMIATLIIVHRFSRQIQDVFSSIEKLRLNWLRNITYMAMAFISIFLFENILFLFGINFSDYFSFSSVIIAFYVYALGYIGLFKSEIFSTPEVAASMSSLPEFTNQRYRDPEARSDKVIKYAKSGLSEEKARHYVTELQRLMIEKEPYTDSELTLTSLAEMLSVSPHNLSQAINTQLDKNFFDLINFYRVERVKKDLTDPKNNHPTLLAIAFDAGFNSKSSFNTIFKKHTNKTPGEYRHKNTDSD